VRQAFTNLLAAVKTKDTDKLWALLSTKSRDDAERIAKTLREAYAKAGADDKAKQEKATGLSDTDLKDLTGKGYLKSQPFQRRYHDLPGSKLERLVVSGDNATVYYTETDGDKEKCIFLRQDGRWMAWLSIPRPSFAAPAADDGKPARSIALADVGKHVDEKCVVEFEVKSTGKSGDLVFLNSEPNFRDEKNFTIVLTKEATEKIQDAASHFKGQKVRVTGLITLYRDKPQIKVEGASNVQVVERKNP
jgi:hypothetical protein